MLLLYKQKMPHRFKRFYGGKRGNMVPVLARMAVIIKSDYESNIITGNYEMAYVCGLFYKLTQSVPPEFHDAKEMQQYSLQLCDSWHPDDPREQNLIRMLKLYKPDENYDEQVKELFQMGLNEKNMWKKTGA